MVLICTGTGKGSPPVTEQIFLHSLFPAPVPSVIVGHGAFPKGDNSDRHFSLKFFGTVTSTGEGGNSDGHLY